MYIHTYIHTYVCVYIYIYIYDIFSGPFNVEGSCMCAHVGLHTKSHKYMRPM
jgi:hypothetical protein